MTEYTHWLKATGIPGSPWVKVSKEEWVKAERSAGFRPKAMDTGQYATCGFSSGIGISGSLTSDDNPPTW